MKQLLIALITILLAPNLEAKPLTPGQFLVKDTLQKTLKNGLFELFNDEDDIIDTPPLEPIRYARAKVSIWLNKITVKPFPNFESIHACKGIIETPVYDLGNVPGGFVLETSSFSCDIDSEKSGPLKIQTDHLIYLQSSMDSDTNAVDTKGFGTGIANTTDSNGEWNPSRYSGAYASTKAIDLTNLEISTGDLQTFQESKGGELNYQESVTAFVKFIDEPVQK